MKAFLILEDGTVFEGGSVGASGDVVSEVVCNTSMTGYLEWMTDPGLAGQAMVMTYPLIGNYGVCKKDMESRRPWVDGLVVREMSRIPSNFRSEGSLSDFMEEYEITGIEGVDTRALTQLLRDKGAMRGMITCNEGYDASECVERIRAYRAEGLVKRTSRKKVEEYAPGDLDTDGSLLSGKAVAVLDLGARRGVIRGLLNAGCKVRVHPSDTAAEDVLKGTPDGVLVSGGPGNPKDCPDIIKEVAKLYQSDVPILAIGLGHELLALATGGDAIRMKYGHRGSNYPVKDLKTGKVYISLQNHGYVVDGGSVDPEVAGPRFVNVNDGTVEGLEYVGKRITSVQFYPSACVGGRDTEGLLARFLGG